ncbi:hypothetical protein CGRA01v4_10062 [Colletotrichum graminicola]|nr:hypothetical protein CGRA01v4_10062 [Colletotrichum graminicola]
MADCFCSHERLWRIRPAHLVVGHSVGAHCPHTGHPGQLICYFGSCESESISLFPIAQGYENPKMLWKEVFAERVVSDVGILTSSPESTSV